MEGSKKKFTVGVLVSGIMDEFSQCVCRGVAQEAKKADVNIVVFPGKYWERDLSDNRELRYEYQYSTIFSYAQKSTVDALIIAEGSISCFATKEGMDQLIQRYKGIPCVLLASRREGYIDVSFDNYQGIKDGLEYLIAHRKCKKFGMVGGSLKNTDAYERKMAFVQTLEQHGIPFQESMYVEGDFSRRSSDVYKKLLDDNPDLEAVFCVNDDTALGFYEEVKRRGLRVGRDIYVLGYDDTIVAGQAVPSLSSVRADSAMLGAEALRMVLRMIQGEQLESRVLPTQFIRRDSFCKDEDYEGTEQLVNKDCDESFNEIFFRYQHEEMAEEMSRLRIIYKELMKILEAREGADSDSSENYAEIMLYVDEFAQAGGVKYADVDCLLEWVEDTYRAARERRTGEKAKEALRDVFFNIYRKIICSTNGLIAEIKATEEKKRYEMKLFVQNMLQFEKGKDQSYSVLLENLDWLQIKNAQIYMFPEPILHLFKEKFEVPKELLLKAELQNGEVRTIPSIQQKRKLATIFSNHIDERGPQVLLPLFFNEMVYGVMLCDLKESLFINGELLVNQTSSAVKMINLLEANEKIQCQLEENVAVLKDYNIELDTLSKSDVLTGILNRRGFYSVAEERIAANREAGKSTLAVYVDMNNLKIINDRYGHEEGDFSLKLIGEFLKEMVGSQGAAGRIGGDEYACVMDYEGTGNGEELLDGLYERFEVFNAGSDKPYNITVSAGNCLLKAEDLMTVKEALQLADEKLYEVKQNRKKDVAKISNGK